MEYVVSIINKSAKKLLICLSTCLETSCFLQSIQAEMVAHIELPVFLECVYDITRFIYVHSKADAMASLI